MHRLLAFENKESTEEKEEVTGEWRKLRSKELHKLNSSSDVIRMMK
jgi:hypothetical protein